MERVAELSLKELEKEERPYRIVGWQEGIWAIEYTDDPNDYEYSYTMNPDTLNEKKQEDWEIYFITQTGSGSLFNLRRLLDV